MTSVHQLDREPLPVVAELEIAGRRCALRTNREAVAASMKPWIVPRAAASATSDFTLDVFVNHDLSPSTSPPAFRGMGHLVTASFGDDYFGFDLQRRTIAGMVGLATATNARFWNHVLLPIAIGVLGCAIGVVPMHCACLEWNGEGILIAGLSGAGKSTLAAAMGSHGFSFLSDDWTYISHAEGELTAYGLGVPVKLLPDAVRFFAALRRYRTHCAMNGELAFEVSPAELGFQTRPCTRPRRLFLLERNEGVTSRFERADSSVVQHFFEASSERLPDSLEAMRARRSRVIEDVARLECWNFSCSGSPHDAAAAIQEFLERP